MNLPFKKPGPRARIDWPKAVAWYNNATGENFKDEEELLRTLRQLFPVKFIAEIFDVTAPTIEARLKWYGIGYTSALKDSHPNKKQFSLDKKPKKELGRKGLHTYKFFQIPDEQLKKMTSVMIANEIGCSCQYATILCSKYGKDYVHRAPGRPVRRK